MDIICTIFGVHLFMLLCICGYLKQIVNKQDEMIELMKESKTDSIKK